MEFNKELHILDVMELRQREALLSISVHDSVYDSKERTHLP